MAISAYDDAFLTEEQKRQIEKFQAMYQDAYARGDHAGMDAAHAAAEAVRKWQGYSGTVDGFGFVPLEGDGAGENAGAYSPPRLPSYEAQTDAVDRLYDAAAQAQMEALKKAFDESSAVLEGEKREIPGLFQAQRNAAAGQAETAGRNFNEYAAASGLNSGTGGQAALARANQLQGDLSALDAQEAAERRAVDRQLSQLKIRYQDEIAQAVADGEFRRAAALLQEYQKAAESAVSAAQAQADLDMKAWQANTTQRQWQQQFDYQKSRNP